MPRKASAKFPYLISAEVAEAVGISLATLDNWIRTKKVTPPELDERNRYRKWTPEHIVQIRQQIRDGGLSIKPGRHSTAKQLREAS